MENHGTAIPRDVLQKILKDSRYNLSLFSAEEIEVLHQRVFTKGMSAGSQSVPLAGT